ncbi:maleylpyruvate isomerase family mycothiol-dependent enzyme [Nocardia sp. NPDC057668]|uniref:maleylpyruvate isomerase family mycothiol-dependent enzyme n=1 Tax=Nocardia sp. NPDC057668 TaxID=3346202 RepID=UPI003672F3E3
MEPSRYLDLILADSNTLLASARLDPGAAAPSCPGWTAADVAGHVAQVYEHKVLCMTLGHEPPAEERKPLPTPGPALWAFFISTRDALLEQLTERGPAQPSFTWFPPDQSVGFWFRRMALETAIHRVDAELATGTNTAIDPDLAVAGIDEMIDFLTYDFGDSPTLTAGANRTVRLQTHTRRWALTLRANGVDRAHEDTPPDAQITATPEDLLLHLWNRDPGNAPVTEWGDPAALATLAARISEETQ